MDTADRLNNALERLSPVFKEQGIEPAISRFGEVDIAYPVNENEYCVLGGYTVFMVVAISECLDELPIEKAYFQVGEKVLVCAELGVHVDGDELRNRVTEKKDRSGRTCFENISFWVLPVGYFKIDAGFIAIDFKGERKNFTILRGPWKLDSRVDDLINKHFSEQIKVAEHVPYDELTKFVEREYFKNNRVQL